MGQAELMEHAQLAFGNAIAAFALIFTIFSAYLVVAYYAGSKLSSSQISIINVFFVVSVVMTIGAEHGFIAAGVNSALEAARMSGSEPVVPLHPLIPHIITVTDLLITGACLKFMWDVRRSENNDEVN